MRRVILTGKVSIYLFRIILLCFSYICCLQCESAHTHTSHTSHTIRRQQVLQVTLNEPFKLSADSVKRFWW